MRIWLATAAAILTAQASSAQAAGELVRIALVGDSTVAEGGGWGPGFRDAFGPGVEVLNFAQNGRSSKSYRAEGFWEPALAARPHYVLIQFGHNDNPGKGPDRETDPATTYRANLSRYLDEARAAGAIPILVTSIVRRALTPDSRVIADANLPYVEEVRRLGESRHVPVMDLYTVTLQPMRAAWPRRLRRPRRDDGSRDARYDAPGCGRAARGRRSAAARVRPRRVAGVAVDGSEGHSRQPAPPAHACTVHLPDAGAPRSASAVDRPRRRFDGAQRSGRRGRRPVGLGRLRSRKTSTRRR